ncbi:meteorin isoform X2 [Panthera leo]|uniref:meteorin isoform X2 n=1 Tax=Panthera leo TaxID=9689 RepID=UPI001C6A4658|nr:meteorin isoform X2 [Panthera leo]
MANDSKATPHPDISRRVASFRFETHEDRYPELPPQAHGLGADGVCRPCSDAELLLTACTSDFVINGTIRGVAHNTELQESVITVAAARVLRQTLPLFRVGESGGQASIHTPLRCGVRPGPGAFLFMGWSRFAWTFPLDSSPHRRASRQRPEEEEMGVLSRSSSSAGRFLLCPGPKDGFLSKAILTLGICPDFVVSSPQPFMGRTPLATPRGHCGLPPRPPVHKNVGRLLWAEPLVGHWSLRTCPRKCLSLPCTPPPQSANFATSILFIRCRKGRSGYG